MSLNPKIVIPAIAASTIAVGGGAAYYFLKVQPAQEVANPRSSFAILPQNTMAAGYLSLDEKTWKKASKFGTPEARTLIDQQIEALKSNLTRNSPSGQPINFDQDIKPWIGSVTVAGIKGQDKDSPEMLMVVGIKDKFEALKFAAKQKDDAQESVTISKYKGVDIYEFSGDSAQFLAILDNHLVLAEQKSLVESAIAADQGADSVLRSGSIKQVLEDSLSVKNPVAVGMVNIPSIAEQMLESSATPLDEGPLETLREDLDAYQAVAVAWGIEDQGFRFKNVLKQSQDAPWRFEPLPGKIVARFPENTLALIHGGYLEQAWRSLQTQLEKDPGSKSELDSFLRQFTAVTQLDFTQDVVDWLDGEFGFGIVPSRDGILSQIGFGGAIALQTSDRSKAEQTLSKLDQMAQGGGAQISKKQIAGVSMTQWGIPFQGSLVNYGWLDDQTLLLTLGESTATQMAEASGNSVQKNAIFQSVTSSLPDSEQGLFYVNAAALFETAQASPTMGSILLARPEMNAFLGSVQAIAMTGQQQSNDTVVGEALVTFKQE